MTPQLYNRMIENHPVKYKKKILLTHSILRCCYTFALLIALLLTMSPSLIWAKSNYTDTFNTTYGTSGARGLDTIGSCITCHPGALNGSSQLNDYSTDWLIASHNYSAVEAMDSDGDGYDNLTEILAGTMPGDNSSVPTIPAGEAPIASAGSDQTVAGGSVVTLDGSQSSDPDGTISTYSWTQTTGPTVSLSNSAAAATTFNAPNATDAVQALTFVLTVTDNSGMEGTDTCVVTIAAANLPPVANAGPDQNVDPGLTVILDGSGSSDANGQIVANSWLQLDGMTVTLSDPNMSQPSFIAPDPGPNGASLTFQLTVTDDEGAQSTATCIVNIIGVNQPPTADAGSEQNVFPGDIVTLDGSASSDTDGLIATYLWEQTAGPAVVLSDSAAAQPTFTAPDTGSTGATLTFKLTVTDDFGSLASATSNVNVMGVNEPPVADGGGSVSVEEGVVVLLDGSGSYDPDGGIASYLWQQVGDGTGVVVLSDPDKAQTYFLTPSMESGDLTLTFRLTVQDDGGLSNSDDVVVTISDNGLTGFPAGVVPIATVTGQPIGIANISGGVVTQIESLALPQAPAASATSMDLAFGLLDLKVKPNLPGGVVSITFHLSEMALDSQSWFKFNPTSGEWTDYSEVTDVNGYIGAVFNSARDEVTITLIDGGIGDDDGTADGMIIDPSGLGTLIPAANTPGSPEDYDQSGSNNFNASGGCFISTLY